MKVLLCVLAALLLLRSSTAMTDSAPPKLDLTGYKMTFEDTFKTIDVSSRGPGTRWIAHTPWNGDFGDAAFADPRPGFPFSVQDGRLRIEARKDAAGKWQSGLLASTDASRQGFQQQFGYFEIRAKLPEGPGLWPGFWLIGNKAPGGSAEADILEYLSHDPSKYEATVHVWPRNNQGRYYQAQIKVPVEPGSLVKSYHLFGASIERDFITFYLDRTQVGQTPTPPEFSQPLFILVSMAMGSGFPIDKTPNPSFMDVEYVRVWQKQAQPQRQGAR